MPIQTPGQSGPSYEIRIRDHLETYWCAFFEGWSMQNLANGEVLLSRTGVDQAALHGVLNKICDLNLTILYVRRIENEEIEKKYKIIGLSKPRWRKMIHSAAYRRKK